MRSGGWIGGRQLSHPCEDLRRIHGAFLRYQPIDVATMFVSIGSGLGGNDADAAIDRNEGTSHVGRRV